MIPGSLDDGESIDLTWALRRLNAFFLRFSLLRIRRPGRLRI
jgi:hypothetical protein